MKIVIVGLGNFGSSLAVYLTDMGNEVIGVDNKMEKVDRLKDTISHTVCMDATNEMAYEAVPVKNADLAVIAIGENEGATIIATAIIKKLTDAKIISRSLSPIHDTVLHAMGIETIVHPEQEFAEALAKKINLKSMINNFELDPNHSISEIKALPEFEGKTLQEIDFRNEYNLNIITIIRKERKTTLFGTRQSIGKVLGAVNKDSVVQANDILVVFGANKDIAKFCSIE
ncbi:potassium channel family protein [Sinomicrobium weinanense]|uniref:TrkA family potassium uptake protein n=1 Tax=Sinomicrobium weinanense TaxID=2842200 RepID=A0A926Q2F6_9FLAO|nr:TrkA family potassium uptake protein [Sinomicrobium weinanense]MBC9794620.1 TrkA family potassium uptake protein [Sinomicrobium weinanense]MBU3124105.1 TrkA family potassium uptake protein [Sinomicrobium weinanense]